MYIKTNDIVMIDNNLYKYLNTTADNGIHVFMDDKGATITVHNDLFKTFIKRITNVFEPLHPEDIMSFDIKRNNEFKLSDLKEGMTLLCRDGRFNGIVEMIDGKLQISHKEFTIKYSDMIFMNSEYFLPIRNIIFRHSDLSMYREDMRHRTIKRYDIISVYLNSECIYERPECSRLLTIDDAICAKKFGAYEVKNNNDTQTTIKILQDR